MPLIHQRQGRRAIFISAYSLWLSIVKDIVKQMDGIHFLLVYDFGIDGGRTIRKVIRIIAVRLQEEWVGMKPKSGQGNLADEVVDRQQEQRQ